MGKPNCNLEKREAVILGINRVETWWITIIQLPWGQLRFICQQILLSDFDLANFRSQNIIKWMWFWFLSLRRTRHQLSFKITRWTDIFPRWKCRWPTGTWKEYLEFSQSHKRGRAYSARVCVCDMLAGSCFLLSSRDDIVIHKGSEEGHSLPQHA